MFVLANVLAGLATLLHSVFTLFWGVLLARIVLSWVRPSPPPGIVRSIISAVYQLTDPVLDRARSWLPFLVVGGIDLSPIAVFLALGFVDQVLTTSLLQAAHALA